MTSNASIHKEFSLVPIVRAGIAALAILITLVMQLAPGTTGSWFANEWLRDRFITLRASSLPEHRILVVDIDEASIAAIGPWPWRREQIAALIENLLDTYASKGVALDLVLPEPADAAGDMRLSMLAQHAPVILAAAFDYNLKPGQPLRVGQINSISTSTSTSTSGGTIGTGKMAARAAGGFIGNHSGLSSARHVGNIGFIPDQDGTIRRLPLETSFEGKRYPTLSLALLACCARDAASGELNAPDVPDAPDTVDALWRIPYQRQWGAYTVVAAADILSARIPPAIIRGRLALIGSSSLGLTDRVPTPLSASTSGLLVHAAALTSLLDARAGITPAPWPGRVIAVLFSLALAVMATFTFPRISAAANILLLGGAALLWAGIAFVIVPHDPVMVVSGPLMSVLFLLSFGVPFDWQVTQVKSQRLLGTLNQYVAKSVVTELLRSDLKDPLSPVQREVTTLIADMESYTGHVAALPVEDAARLTRDFLDCLTRPVLNRSGTLDKYTGDGLVAFWGAPLPNPDHADLALEAARDIVLEVRRFSAARERKGLPPLRVRIGIESGIAMAGDFGSTFRSIYTAVGDSVNVASRLEQLARELPFDVIVGPGTAASAKRHGLRPLGDMVLRGKDNPTALFALEVPA